MRFARPYQGTTGGRPLAAALVVNELEGLVVGRAVSSAVAGAEAAALEQAGSAAFGRTLITTLEPEPVLVTAAGIARVVIGAEHPDPGLRGASVETLREAGIEVDVVEHAGSAGLLEPFSRRVERGRPFVTLRLAVSRDGMIARKDGSPVTVMGDVAARWSFVQRALSDGVMIGAHTAALDDPRLDAGLEGFEDRPFARIVLVGTRALPERLNITGWVSGHPTFLIVAEGRDVTVPSFVEVVQVRGRNGRPELRPALAMLAERNISSLLVEGGARLTEAMLTAELVDRLHLVECRSEIGKDGLPATLLGGIEGRLRAVGLIEKSRQPLGEDVLRTFEPEF